MIILRAKKTSDPGICMTTKASSAVVASTIETRRR